MKATSAVMIGIIPLLMVIGACASTYQCPDGSKVAKLELCKGKTPIERTKATNVLKTETSPPEEKITTIVRERQWMPTNEDEDKSKKRKSKAANEEIKNNGNNNATQVSWEKFAVECTRQERENSGVDAVRAVDQCLLQYAVNYEEVIYCGRISNATIKELCYQKMKAQVIYLGENETRENNATDHKLAENISNQACIDLGCPAGTLYTGSKNSDIYHECHCGFAKRITTENRVCFNTIPPGRRPSARC